MPRKTKQELENEKAVRSTNALLRKPKQKAPPRKSRSSSPNVSPAPTTRTRQRAGDKKFAYEASVEFASRVSDSMTAADVMKLMTEYVPFAGWKNPAKALAAKYGLTRYEERE